MIPLRWLIVGALALIVFVVGYTLANQFPPPTVRVTPPLTDALQTRTPTAEERQAQVVTLTNEAEGEPVVFLPLPTYSTTPSPRASATSEPRATATQPVKASATAEPNTNTPTTLPTATAEVTVPVPPSNEPRIVSFELDTSSVAWNGEVTATWETTGYDRLILNIAAANDEIPWPLPTPSNFIDGLPVGGSQVFTIEELLGGVCAVPTITFELTTYSSTSNVTDIAVQTLSIDLNGYPVALDSFTMSPNPVASNGSTTISYSGRGGDTMRLWGDYFLTGGYQNGWNNAAKYWGELRLSGASGTSTYQLPNRHIPDMEYFVMYGNGTGPTICATYTLGESCPYTYWIDEPAERTAESCPTSNALTISGSYQRFERGAMIWDADLQRIHILYDDGTNAFYYDEWQGGPLTYPSEIPAGMIAPSQGFGYLWTTDPGIQTKLGWATATEQPYMMTRQWVKNSYGGFYENYDTIGPLYMTLPDGKVVRARIEPMTSGLGWEVLPR